MTKKQKKIYTITNISEEQILVMAKAMDTYCRLGLLQLDHAIIDEIRFSDDFDFAEYSAAIEYHLGEIKRMMILKHKDENVKEVSKIPNINSWSLGIGNQNLHENVQRAYEMSKAIYHKRWKDNPTKHYSVDENEGLKLTSDMRINIKSEDERQIKIKKYIK
jgi:hypothetical protein